MKKTLQKKKKKNTTPQTHAQKHSFLVRGIAVTVAVIMLLAMFLPLFIGYLA